MAKKRAREADGSADAMDVDNKNGGDSDGDDEDFDMVNVEFEWFNFDPEIDFHGTKSLLRQLLDVDSALFDISGLADVILSQNGIGSTVKVDSKETDPYAMLTALNISGKQQQQQQQQQKSSDDNNNNNNSPLKPLTDYLASKASSVPELASSPLPSLLLSDDKEKKLGLILSERLINMPSEIAPPLYRMLEEELADAVSDGESDEYGFTHYLILSKTYREMESLLGGGEEVIYENDDDNDGRKGKKKKKGKLSGADPLATFYFHPEDEVLQRFSLAKGSYPFTKHDENAADSKRAFQELGIAPMGHMILIEAARFGEAVKAVGEYLSPPGGS